MNWKNVIDVVKDTTSDDDVNDNDTPTAIALATAIPVPPTGAAAKAAKAATTTEYPMNIYVSVWLCVFIMHSAPTETLFLSVCAATQKCIRTAYRSEHKRECFRIDYVTHKIEKSQPIPPPMSFHVFFSCCFIRHHTSSYRHDKNSWQKILVLMNARGFPIMARLFPRLHWILWARARKCVHVNALVGGDDGQ